VVRTVFFLSTAVLVVSCSVAPLDPEVDALSAEELAVAVSLSADALASGDTVEVMVTVTNRTKWRINYSNSACPLTVEVTAAGQPPAALTGAVCVLILLPHPLGAHESDTTIFRFTGSAWRPATPPAFEEWVALPAGTYEIVARTNESMLSSEPVSIELLP